MLSRQEVKPGSRKHRLDAFHVLRSKVLVLIPTLCTLHTLMCRCLRVPTIHTVVTCWPVAASLGLLQQGLGLQPFHGMSFDWCIQPKITSAPPLKVAQHLWKALDMVLCMTYGAAFPLMVISPFHPRDAMCVLSLKMLHNKVVWQQQWEECCTLPRARQLHIVLSCTPLEDWDL